MSSRRGCLLLCACLAVIFLRPAVPAAQAPRGAGPEKPARADRHGDPLPAGAIARMGTLRLRHGGPVSFVGYAAGGKVLISAGQGGAVRTWDATGRPLVRLPLDPFGAGDVALSGDGTTLALLNSKEV